MRSPGRPRRGRAALKLAVLAAVLGLALALAAITASTMAGAWIQAQVGDGSRARLEAARLERYAGWGRAAAPVAVMATGAALGLACSRAGGEGAAVKRLTLLAPAPRCDCRVCPFSMDNPGAVEPICSGCNADCAYCGCTRAGGGCGQCPIRCGSRVDIDAWMTDVGGTFAFDDVRLELGPPAALPRYIPQVDGHDVPAFDADLGWPAYGVGLRRVFSPDSLRLYPRFAGVDAHEALGLRAGQLAVLVGYADDPLVEAFWTRRRTLIPAVAAQNWDLVLTPNYSLFGNQPRSEHLLNFRRNLLIAAEMAAEGVAAAPNLYWFRKEDLDRYLEWCERTEPPAVATNLQTLRTEGDWEFGLPGLTYLALNLAPSVRVIVTGASRRDRIGTLVELFGDRLHLVSQNAQQYARHGALMTPAGRVDSPARVTDLFAANVRYYAGLVEGGAAGGDRDLEDDAEWPDEDGGEPNGRS